MSKKKILVGISGGVDSSLVAKLLQIRGYEVIGCFERMHNFNAVALNDCKKLCEALGIELIVEDLVDDFNYIVKRNFFDEYIAGRTPNPCVLCNYAIKFNTLYNIAKANNIDKIATGHYSKVVYNAATDSYSLFKHPSVKDQSYMLWRLDQEVLSKLILPLGDYVNKEVVRNTAKELGIFSFDKRDSQDICFISDNDYRNFINLYAIENGLSNPNNVGDIILNNQIIGQHNGYINYTIGQRRGLGISYKVPLYVKAINAKNNTIEVATIENTYSTGLIATNLNFIKKYANLEYEQEFNVKIRYNDSGKLARCRVAGNNLIITFNEPRRAVTLGQSVVIYDNDELIGGGIIESVIE